MQQEISIQQGSVSIEENSRGHTISVKVYTSTTSEDIDRAAQIAAEGLQRAKFYVEQIKTDEAKRAGQ